MHRSLATRTRPVGHGAASIHSLLLAVSLLVLGCAEGTSATRPGAEANPTGNPIAGGPGYADIKSPAAAAFVVSSKTELLKAIAAARRNQVVYIDDDAEIDLTGVSTIVIPAGVTLASGRGRDGSMGALLFSATYEADVDPLFMAGGEAVRLTGLRLRGPHTEIGDDPDRYISVGARSRYKRLEVDNCEIWGWSHAAVYVDAGCTGARVHHNYIHHNRRDGYGYGVVLGYSSEKNPIGAAIEANLFDFCRHSVASTGRRYGSYTARYNIVLEHANASSFDRHGTEDPGNWYGGDGGDWTIVQNNTVRMTTELAVGVRGVPAKQAQVHQNWFYQPDVEQAWWLYGRAQHPSRYSVRGNVYGPRPPSGTRLPVARARVTPMFADATQAVQFDGSASSAPHGAVRTYEWDFGDGETGTGVSATHVYNRVGRYNATLRVTDERGVPEQTTVPVTVYPAPGRFVLDFWVRDSYRGSSAGYYRKESLIDGKVVWRDDVAGDDGWQHVSVDVTNAVQDRTSIDLEFKTQCTRPADGPEANAVALDVFWDDVVLFGAELANGDFEDAASGLWRFAADEESWNGGRFSGEAHTGVASFVLSRPYGDPGSAGSWSALKQAVKIPPRIVRAEWRFDDAAGTVAVDSSPNHLHAALVNVEESSGWVAGILSGATQLDGVDDSIDCTDSPRLKSAAGAVELWMKPQTLGRAMSLFSIVNGDSDNSFLIGVDAASRLRVIVKDNGATKVDLTTTNTAIADTGFHHVVVTQAGTGVSVFVDGEKSGTSGSNSNAWTGHLSEGNVTAGAGSGVYFRGALDQLVIYSESLSVEEIRSRYDRVQPRGVWHLDEGKGIGAADSSSFGNDGKLIGMDTGSSWVSGKAGTALRFAGGEGKVDCGSAPSLKISDEITITMWVKFDAFGEDERLMDNDLYKIFHRGDWAGDSIYFLYRIEEDAASGDSAWDNWGGVVTETELKAGKWYHIAAVKGGDRVRIYVNGVKEREIDCLLGYDVDISRTGPLYVGGSGFRGTLDEITITPRAFEDDDVLRRFRESAQVRGAAEIDERAWPVL